MIFSWVLVMKTTVESSANRSAESIEGSSYNSLLTHWIYRDILNIPKLQKEEEQNTQKHFDNTEKNIMIILSFLAFHAPSRNLAALQVGNDHDNFYRMKMNISIEI